LVAGIHGIQRFAGLRRSFHKFKAGKPIVSEPIHKDFFVKKVFFVLFRNTHMDPGRTQINSHREKCVGTFTCVVLGPILDGMNALGREINRRGRRLG
jgi:hypothetical protein